jgi:hypothetical protein
VPEQGRADVDGQPVVDKLGREVPAEVVRGEGDAFELLVGRAQLVDRATDVAPDRGGGHAPLGRAVAVLEQERHRLGERALVGVVAGADRDGAVLGDVAADDLRDDVEQLGRHGDDPLAVALGRADHQQGDDLVSSQVCWCAI